jgi:hypothetical protein
VTCVPAVWCCQHRNAGATERARAIQKREEELALARHQVAEEKRRLYEKLLQVGHDDTHQVTWCGI